METRWSSCLPFISYESRWITCRRHRGQRSSHKWALILEGLGKWQHGNQEHLRSVVDECKSQPIILLLTFRCSSALMYGSAITTEAGSKLHLDRRDGSAHKDFLPSVGGVRRPWPYPYNNPSLWHLTANYRRLWLYASQSHDAISFFDAWTSAFRTKHIIQSHFNHSSYLCQHLTNQDWTYCPYLQAVLYLYMTRCLEEFTSPRGNAHVEGLTSDPEQRRGFFVMRRQTPHFTRQAIYLCRQRNAFTTKNAESVPEELLSDGRCLLSACRCHWLITSHHSPFASQLIQSSKPLLSLYTLSMGK